MGKGGMGGGGLSGTDPRPLAHPPRKIGGKGERGEGGGF